MKEAAAKCVLRSSRLSRRDHESRHCTALLLAGGRSVAWRSYMRTDNYHYTYYSFITTDMSNTVTVLHLNTLQNIFVLIAA